ncbi:MAG TPA: AbrB family transcriptional regulator [Acidobacteriaceae bacterium]
MPRTAKLFMNGRSQAVRLPSEFRFDGNEVSIRKDPETGDVILSRKPKNLDRFFAMLEEVPAEERAAFKIPRDRAPLKPRKIF